MKTPQRGNVADRACAFAAFAFAISPAIGIFAYEALERARFAAQNTPRGGGPVAIGVPPPWVFALGSLVVAVPWIAAGCLSLAGRRWAKWAHLALTLPTCGVLLLIGVGLSNEIRAYAELSSPSSLETMALLAPIALCALLYCAASVIGFATSQTGLGAHE